MTRRTLIAGAATLAASPPWKAAAASRTVRVGYQKYGNLLLLKASGLLETHLQQIGWDVEWKPFLSGPPLMEALAAGAIDFGTAGETPPIFAQAAGAAIVYHGSEPPAPAGEGILVLNDSPIRAIADLKGKKIALNKGSNVHYLFVRALEKAGLTPQDVTPVYLSPPDGRAAFERGGVDAWVIWDPYFAAAQSTGHTRLLVDGLGLVANHQFYLGNRRFAEHPVLDAVRAAVIEIDQKTKGDPGAAATILRPETGLPENVIATALKRQTWTIMPMDAKLVEEQQVIADTFFKLGLIKKSIRIADALPTA